MSQFSFRLRFDFPDGNYIDSEADELEVLHTPAGQVFRLRSGARGSPVKTHSTANIVAGPFATADDARRSAEQARNGLLVWSVNQRIGIDVGGRPPTGLFTTYGLEEMSKQQGQPVRNDVHGIDVYEAEQVLFIRCEAKVAVGKQAEAFVDAIRDSASRPFSLTEKQILAAELFSLSFF
jgi:hypothetical protein